MRHDLLDSDVTGSGSDLDADLGLDLLFQDEHDPTPVNAVVEPTQQVDSVNRSEEDMPAPVTGSKSRRGREIRPPGYLRDYCS